MGINMFLPMVVVSFAVFKETMNELAGRDGEDAYTDTYLDMQFTLLSRNHKGSELSDRSLVVWSHFQRYMPVICLKGNHYEISVEHRTVVRLAPIVGGNEAIKIAQALENRMPELR
jgi:hypothetical protein